MQKQYLIVYDISDIKRLQKVAKILLNVGVRVQKSVFEAYLNTSTLKAVIVKLQRVIEPEDGIKIFQLCEKCAAKRTSVGNAPPSVPLTEWIVI